MERTGKQPAELHKTCVMGKKPYSAPVLMVHGTVQEITKDASLTNLDGPTGS